MRLDGGEPTDDELDRFSALLAHRGPDADGRLQLGRAALVHRRLAVVDIHHRADQPLRADHLTIVFNGEIYNHAELRAHLESCGRRFSTRSDTEVLLQGYAAWGDALLDRLEGDFAFVIHDARTGAIFGARDRIGVKPLYYLYRDGRCFAFASEIKALLDYSARRPRPEAVAAYLTYGQTDGEDAQFFDDIRQVPAAHCFHLEGGRLRWRRYWRCPIAERPAPEALDQYVQALRSAIARRMVADVPMGTCLSGGLDSSTIVGLERALGHADIHTFSCRFPEPECDEGPWIDAVNLHCRTTPHAISPRHQDLPGLLPRLLWHLDEPPGAYGVIPEWHVLRLAGDSVTVVLNGQGGDETLAGYDHYRAHHAGDLFRRGRWSAARAVFRGAPPQVRGRWWRAFLGSFLDASTKRRLKRWWCRGEGARHLAFAPPRPAVSEPPRQGGSYLNRVLLWDLQSRILPALLRFEDRLGMAHAVEVRVPFLAHPVVEAAFRIHADQKIQGPWSKFPLRRVAAGVLPSRVVGRTDKKGFPTPLGAWFRGPLQPWLRSILLDRVTLQRGIFDAGGLERLIREHVDGVDRTWPLWWALCAELWHRIFLDRSLAPDPQPPRPPRSLAERC